MNSLREKMTLTAFAFSKLRTLKTWLDKYLQSPISEDASRSNIVNLPKHCWNLYHSTFIILIDHCEGNSVGKSLSYLHVKSWDCLVTHWLPMKSVLFLIGKIEWYQFRFNYIRNKKIFWSFFRCFWNLE